MSDDLAEFPFTTWLEHPTTRDLRSVSLYCAGGDLYGVAQASHADFDQPGAETAAKIFHLEAAARKYATRLATDLVRQGFVAIDVVDRARRLAVSRRREELYELLGG